MCNDAYTVLDKGEAGEEIVAGERYGKDINY